MQVPSAALHHEMDTHITFIGTTPSLWGTKLAFWHSHRVLIDVDGVFRNGKSRHDPAWARGWVLSRMGCEWERIRRRERNDLGKGGKGVNWDTLLDLRVLFPPIPAYSLYLSLHFPTFTLLTPPCTSPSTCHPIPSTSEHSSNLPLTPTLICPTT